MNVWERWDNRNRPDLGKRLTKRPRVYWRDSGLLHALYLVADLDDLHGRPWVGASWEGFVIEQAIATLLQSGPNFEASFFRTSDGHELDLLLDFGREQWAVEVKLTTAPTPQHLAALNKAADMVGAKRRFLVSQTRENLASGATWSCDLPTLVDELASMR